jgi:hypothetical protein
LPQAPFLGVDAFFYNAAVEQMDGSVGVAGIAGSWVTAQLRRRDEVLA